MLDEVGADDRIAEIVSFHELDFFTAVKLGGSFTITDKILAVGIAL